MYLSREKIYGSAGEYSDYGEVLGEYRASAVKTMDEDGAPYGMREIVTQYFDSLEH